MSMILRQCLITSRRSGYTCLRAGGASRVAALMILDDNQLHNRVLLERRVPFHTTPHSYRKKDYYEILGVPRNASHRDIKKAYISLAKKFHPDANPENADVAKQFHDIAEAYTVLSNKKDRDAYDGHGAQTGPSTDFDPVRRSYTSPYESFHSSVNPEDLFRKIFGADFNDGDFMKKSKRVWVDYAQTDGSAKTEGTIVRLTFREAAKGCDKVITAKTVTTCEKCMGMGAEPGRPVQVCPFCEGIGYEIIEGHDGHFKTSCRFCLGKGHNVVHKCSFCLGFGKTLVDRSIVLPIPPGMLDGETLKVNIDPSTDDATLGDEERQHVFITFRVEPSDYFEVDEETGIDLHSKAKISLSQAIFGGKIKIDGLYSDESIRVEPGTDSHTTVRLVGKGLKKSSGYGFGDHIVHLKIEIPKVLTGEQKKLLLAYAETEVDTSGEIDGVKKREASPETKADPEADYSAVDADIEFMERKRMGTRSFSQNPWFVMARETIAPVGRFFRLGKVLVSTLLSRK